MVGLHIDIDVHRRLALSSHTALNLFYRREFIRLLAEVKFLTLLVSRVRIADMDKVTHDSSHQHHSQHTAIQTKFLLHNSNVLLLNDK